MDMSWKPKTEGSCACGRGAKASMKMMAPSRVAQPVLREVRTVAKVLTLLHRTLRVYGDLGFHRHRAATFEDQIRMVLVV